jgi:hypothetical protein
MGHRITKAAHHARRAQGEGLDSHHESFTDGLAEELELLCGSNFRHVESSWSYITLMNINSK